MWVGAYDLRLVSRNVGSVADNVGRGAAPVSINLGCARRSLGKGNGNDLKPFVGTQRVAIPARDKAGQPSGSESCVVVGRPTLRSVDSEWAGRVIEPRN